MIFSIFAILFIRFPCLPLKSDARGERDEHHSGIDRLMFLCLVISKSLVNGKPTPRSRKVSKEQPRYQCAFAEAPCNCSCGNPVQPSTCSPLTPRGTCSPARRAARPGAEPSPRPGRSATAARTRADGGIEGWNFKAGPVSPSGRSYRTTSMLDRHL